MAVTCPYCSKVFPASEKIGGRHKSVCAGWLALVPKFPTCPCGFDAPSTPAMSRHRRTCEVWKARDKNQVKADRTRDTLRERYGVETWRQIPGVEKKREVTLLAHYGATNPFSKDSTLYDEIEAKRSGKRGRFGKGPQNPMNIPEYRAKQEAMMLLHHGVVHPLQSESARVKLRQTCQDRYGVDSTGSIPAAIEARRATCLARYGGPAPACDARVLNKMKESFVRVYGVTNPQKSASVRAKTRLTFLRRYGVLHALQHPEFYRKLVSTTLRHYGVRHAMKNPEVVRRSVAAATRPGPNRLERRFAEMNPELLYTGNGAVWCYLPILKCHKNPDFILPGPDPVHPRRGVKKVVELFGDYWHSRLFTGKANFNHVQELVDAWKAIGIDCLVIWESEFKADPVATRSLLLSHLT